MDLVVHRGRFWDEDDVWRYQEWLLLVTIPIPAASRRFGGQSPIPWVPTRDCLHGQVTLRLMQRQWPITLFRHVGEFIDFQEFWLESMLE